MSEPVLLEPTGSATFDEQVTEYVNGGMDGCLCCDAVNEDIKVGHTTITEDGAQISIVHECGVCGAEWMIQYVAYGIQANDPNSVSSDSLN